MCKFKNFEEILKTRKKFAKSIWQPYFYVVDIQVY